MLKNPPAFDGVLDEQAIVWVKHILYDAEGAFVGFIMPKARGEKLEILTAPKLPKYLGKEWNRFRLGADEALVFLGFHYYKRQNRRTSKKNNWSVLLYTGTETIRRITMYTL